MIRLWERDERANRGPTPVDLLLDSYYTLCKLMRIAFEDGEDWLVEILEYQRQETAARAACALEEHERQREAGLVLGASSQGVWKLGPGPYPSGIPGPLA